MNKLLKVFGMALLMIAIFSCESESEDSTEYAKVGETFSVARVYDGTSTTFDYTGLGLDSDSLIELYAVYKDMNDNVLVTVKILFDYHDNNDPKWVLDDNTDATDGSDIIYYEMTPDIYKLNIEDSPLFYNDINYDIDNTATKTVIVLNDVINGKKYHFEGNHNGNGFVKLVKIED